MVFDERKNSISFQMAAGATNKNNNGLNNQSLNIGNNAASFDPNKHEITAKLPDYIVKRLD